MNSDGLKTSLFMCKLAATSGTVCRPCFQSRMLNIAVQFNPVFDIKHDDLCSLWVQYSYGLNFRIPG